MPVGQYSGIVASISPSQTDTSVGLNAVDSLQDPFGNPPVPGLVNLSLEYDHPGYSPIYTLLMASAVNKKAITVNVVPGATTIQGVIFQF
jgi:hypothetical protein